jgi:5,10-methylenetetrahydromethanopterin reductase
MGDVELNFGIELAPKMGIHEIVDLAQLAESVGFRNIWIPDRATFRDTFVVLTAIAKDTQSVHIGPGITNPYTRIPPTIASAMLSLDEISKGRAVLGIGAGDQNTLRQLGLKITKPLSGVQSAIVYLREHLTSIHSNRRHDFQIPHFSNIPIYVGAQGPNMLKLAGTLGDGVIINHGHPKEIQWSLPFIREGLKNRSQTLPYEIVSYLPIALGKPNQSTLEATLPAVAYMVSGSPNVVLKRHALDIDRARKIGAEISRGRLSQAFKLVSQKMIDAYVVVGQAEKVIERIVQLRKLGITSVVLGSPLGADKRKAVEESETVINAFIE